jgi:hypothetical protein
MKQRIESLDDFIVNETKIEESIVTIAGGIFLGILAYRFLKQVIKKVITGIGMNIVLSPEKLHDVVNKTFATVLKDDATREDAAQIALLQIQLNAKIDNREIRKLQDINDIL